MDGQQAVPSAQALAPYAQPDVGRALLDLATSVVPYFALLALMYLGLDVSYLLVLALAVPAAGFLLRTYILFHDCTHGSFLPTKRGNTWLGIALGMFVYSTFHAGATTTPVTTRPPVTSTGAATGDVPDAHRRGVQRDALAGRFGYRLFRNPLVMFGLGPIWALVIKPRLVHGRHAPAHQAQRHRTNVALVVFVGALCWLLGWQAFLLVQAPIACSAGAAGVFLFYVQHQFEDVYWERRGDWSYADAALQGSSYLKLPKVAPVLHRQHRPAPRAPPQRADPELQPPARARREPGLPRRPDPHVLGWLRAVRLKLYDEDRGRLVTFAAARPAGARPMLSKTSI